MGGTPVLLPTSYGCYSWTGNPTSLCNGSCRNTRLWSQPEATAWCPHSRTYWTYIYIYTYTYLQHQKEEVKQCQTSTSATAATVSLLPHRQVLQRWQHHKCRYILGPQLGSSLPDLTRWWGHNCVLHAWVCVCRFWIKHVQPLTPI